MASGVAQPAQERSPLIGGRYLLTSKLYESLRGAVFLAADTAGNESCVLKQARRHAAEREDGSDARDRLRHEAQVLVRLGQDAEDARCPRFIGLAESDGDLFLAMEDVAGPSLEKHINQAARQGRLLNSGQVIIWGREIGSS